MDDQKEQKQKLSKLLKEKRGRQSQLKFCKALGVSLGTLQGWEDERSMPTTVNLERIAVILGKTFTELNENLNGCEYDSPESIAILVRRIKALPAEDFAPVFKSVMDHAMERLAVAA
jgi:transcriptional regulator with XRE-family HTH domain